MFDAVTKVKINFEPSGNIAEGLSSESILASAQKNGVYTIDAPCGNMGKCGKCKVKIVDGKVSPITDEEKSLLTGAEIEANIRLACVVKPLSDVTIFVPQESSHTARKKGTAVLPYEIAADPATTKVVVNVPKANIADHDLRSDITRLKSALEIKVDGVTLHAAKKVNQALIHGENVVTVVIFNNKIIDIESGDTTDRHYGLALDVGTTSIAGYLIDLRTGKEVCADSISNFQSAYGGDVISRIEFAAKQAENTEILRSLATEAVNTLLKGMLESANISKEHIYEAVVVGNTCMSHLFFGIDPTPLGAAPYAPIITDPIVTTAAELGININERGTVRSLPNIAGFVGADTVGVLAASELYNKSGVWIAVDIGTNAEVLSSVDGRVVACSTAAGPAFEGAKISQGMRAQAGAIDGVTITDDIYITTIDDAPAVGVCGSGIIDAVGELVRVGAIEASGRVADVDDLPSGFPEKLAKRITDDGIILSRAEENGKQDILVRNNDIREIQLVKGAIFAGIMTMLDKLNVSADDLDGLIIAGAFGTYITDKHAIGIGLIPKIDIEKLHFIGNAAGTGAKMSIISRAESEKIINATGEVQYIELAGDLTFSDHFMMAMMLAENSEM